MGNLGADGTEKRGRELHYEEAWVSGNIPLS